MRCHDGKSVIDSIEMCIYLQIQQWNRKKQIDCRTISILNARWKMMYECESFQLCCTTRMYTHTNTLGMIDDYFVLILSTAIHFTQYDFGLGHLSVCSTIPRRSWKQSLTEISTCEIELVGTCVGTVKPIHTSHSDNEINNANEQ